MRLRYFAAGLAAFVLCGFGIPGPQGSGGGSFTGGTLTSDLNMGDNDILGANVIQPTSGEDLVINDDTGAAALTIEASTGDVEINSATIDAPGGSLAIRVSGSTYMSHFGGQNIATLPLRMNDDQYLGFGNGFDVFEQGETTNLTDNTATTVFSVQTGDGDMCGLTITYTIVGTDGTEYQAEHGTVRIAIVDDAGGVVSSESGTHSDTSVQALSSGTLTSTWTTVTTDDGSIEVQLNANTSLTPTTFAVRWHANVSTGVLLTVP